jgi:hypothetical protein
MGKFDFMRTIQLSEEEIERWLVRYINRNDEAYDLLHQLIINLRKMENELFEIKKGHDIMVAPMRGYIEEWLRKFLIKLLSQINKKHLQQLCHLNNNKHL